MSARDDYPKLAEWALIPDRSLSWEQLNAALDEIDDLRAALENVRSLNSSLVVACQRRDILNSFQ